MSSATMHQQLMASRRAARCSLPVVAWLLAMIGALQAASAQASGMRVTILNDVPAHFEVLAGAVDTVRTYLHTEPQIVWMTAAQNGCSSNSSSSSSPSSGARTTRKQRSPPFGLLPWLGDAPGHPSWHHMQLCAASSAPSPLDQMRPQLSWGSTDLLICISPELDKDMACHAAARVLRARLIVALVHRADLISRGSRFLVNPPAPMQLMALAPHVAAAVSGRLRQLPVLWASLVAAYRPPSPCNSRACLRGFAVQGTLRKWSSRNGSGLIRNFAGLWQQLLQPDGPGATAAFSAITITVLGKGNRRDLDIPAQLDHRVSFYSGLPYPAFWQHIYSSYALVPAFGNNQYLTTRISSTVGASLTTCVPMIATQDILDVYSFLGEEHVFLQRPGEREVDVMARIMAMDDAELFGRRRALCALRRELGQGAAHTLRAALAEAGSSGTASASTQPF